MMIKTSLQDAQKVIKIVKDKYGFDTLNRPKWFAAIGTEQQQDGGYDVIVYLTSWNDIDMDTAGDFFERIDGVWVGLKALSSLMANYEYDEPEQMDYVSITKVESLYE